jgi:hypothetical protein
VRRGVVFRIERRGPELFARRISGVAIFPCERGREQALAAAFDKGGAERVTRLYRRDDLPEDQRWLRAQGCTGHLTSGSARVEEAAALSDLCFRRRCRATIRAFMALMPAALCVAGSPSLGSGCGQAESTTR